MARHAASRARTILKVTGAVVRAHAVQKLQSVCVSLQRHTGDCSCPEGAPEFQFSSVPGGPVFGSCGLCAADSVVDATVTPTVDSGFSLSVLLSNFLARLVQYCRNVLLFKTTLHGHEIIEIILL
jgi:hypothetical protein